MVELNYYPYNAENEEVIDKLDEEFMVVAVVGDPESGNSRGWDLAIYDDATKFEIKARISNIYNETPKMVK